MIDGKLDESKELGSKEGRKIELSSNIEPSKNNCAVICPVIDANISVINIDESMTYVLPQRSISGNDGIAGQSPASNCGSLLSSDNNGGTMLNSRSSEAVGLDLIKFMSVNARNLRGRDRRDILQGVAKIENISVLLVQETRYDSNFSDGEVEIGGYSLASRSDRINKLGGGAAIYVADNIKYHGSKRHHLCKSIQICEIRIGDYFIFNVYRAPQASDKAEDDLKLSKFLRKISSKRAILAGDFNLASVHWERPGFENKVAKKDSETFGSLKDLGWIQHVKVKTRHEADHEDNNNILDLVFTSEEDYIHDKALPIKCSFPKGYSDHLPVVFEVPRIQRQKEKTRQIYDYSKACYDTFNALIRSKNLVDITGCLEIPVVDKWIAFKLAVLTSHDKAVPKKTIGTNKNSPWMSKDLLRLLNKIKRLRKVRNKFPGQEDNYLLQLYLFKDKVKEARIAYENDIINDLNKDCKKLYKYMKDIRGHGKGGIKALKRSDGSSTGNQEEMATMLNHQYRSYFNSATRAAVDWNHGSEDSSYMDNILVTKSMVMHGIKIMKNKSAPGLDGITPLMLKKGAENLALPLANLFNHSMMVNEIPEDWKEAIVTPVFKKGPRDDPANYRPVCLNSQVCKLFEWIIGQKIMAHLENGNFMDPNQHGFRPGHSCDSNLIASWERIAREIESKGGSSLVLIDFSKAFDLVDCVSMSKAIMDVKISGKLGKWLENWLVGRKQKVRVGDKMSEDVEVTSGLAQGSRLGPLLWTIFARGLTKDLSLPYLCFADDLKLMADTSTQEGINELQKNLTSISKWAEENRMKISTSKSGIIPIGKHQVKEDLILGGGTIPWVEEGTDLGVKITTSGKFYAHVEEKVNKCNSIIGQIRRNLKVRTVKCLSLIWNTLILPTLCYAGPAWYQNLPGLNRDLNGVYTRFWKLFRGPIPDVMTPIEYIECQSLKIAHKIINDNYPVKKNIFDLATGQRSMASLSLNCIKAKSKIRKEAFSARIVEDWNKLDPNIKTSSTGQFAESSKNFVMDKHRGSTVPYTRERISQRTPYF